MSKRKRRRLYEEQIERAAIKADKRASVSQGNMLERISQLARLENDTLEFNAGYSYQGWKYTGGVTSYNPDRDYHERISQGEFESLRRSWERKHKSNGNGKGNRHYGHYDYSYGYGYGQPASQPAATTFHVQAKSEEAIFHCESAEITGKCPIAQVPGIYVPKTIWDAWVGLAEAIDTEWIAYFTAHEGERDGRASWEIDSYYFPPQTATATSVDVPTGYTPDRAVTGAVHSHVKMAAFWSGTDKAHSNWPIEIVLNAYGKYEALMRHKLQCGNYAKSETKVWTIGPAVEASVIDLLKVAFKNGQRLVSKGKGRITAEDNSPEPEQAPPKEPQQEGSLAVFTSWSQFCCCSHAKDEHGLQGCGEQGCACKAINAREITINESANSASQPEADHDSQPVTEELCPACQGIGLVDSSQVGDATGVPDTDICSRCNGWGQLMDGRPISAAVPNDLDIM